jgi:protein-disulfide isomerase
VPASPAAPPATTAEPDALTLERSPGLTPALPDNTFPAPADAPDLPGQGGPSPAMGPENAPVVVFIFSDFQCPVCRRAVEPLKKLVRAHDPLVRVVFKHQALAMHDRARPTAIASLAAFRHQRFFAFHDRVFEAAHDLSDAALEGHAEAVGVPLDAFRTALGDAALASQVDRETAIGERLGVRGTPGFVVNGDVSVGWGSYLALEHPVKEAIAAFRASGKPASLATARALTAEKNAEAAKLLFPAP